MRRIMFVVVGASFVLLALTPLFCHADPLRVCVAVSGYDPEKTTAERFASQLSQTFLLRGRSILGIGIGQDKKESAARIRQQSCEYFVRLAWLIRDRGLASNYYPQSIISPSPHSSPAEVIGERDLSYSLYKVGNKHAMKKGISVRGVEDVAKAVTTELGQLDNARQAVP